MVEHLCFAASGVGLFGLFANARGQVAGVDSGTEEGEQGNPVLRIGDSEGAYRRQEEVVEQRGGGDGDANRITKTPVTGEDKYQQQQGERNCGVVRAAEVVFVE